MLPHPNGEPLTSWSPFFVMASTSHTSGVAKKMANSTKMAVRTPLRAMVAGSRRPRRLTMVISSRPQDGADPARGFGDGGVADRVDFLGSKRAVGGAQRQSVGKRPRSGSDAGADVYVEEP